MLCLCPEINKLAAQIIRDLLILILGIDNNDHIVGSKEYLDQLQLGIHALAGTGNAQNKTIPVFNELPVSEQDILGYLINAIEHTALITKFAHHKRCKRGQRLREHGTHGTYMAHPDRQCGINCLDLLIVSRNEGETLPLSHCQKRKHIIFQLCSGGSGYHSIQPDIKELLIILVHDIQVSFQFILFPPFVIADIA